jgi:hypothetical protein
MARRQVRDLPCRRARTTHIIKVRPKISGWRNLRHPLRTTLQPVLSQALKAREVSGHRSVVPLWNGPGTRPVRRSWRRPHRPEPGKTFVAGAGPVREPLEPGPPDASSPRSSRTGSKPSSTGPPSSTGSSPRPASASTPNRRRPQPFQPLLADRRAELASFVCVFELSYVRALIQTPAQRTVRRARSPHIWRGPR